MKSVLISIQPKWCELIASEKKTVEVRTTRPKLETPFKCYIYCTKPKKKLVTIIKDGDDVYGTTHHGKSVFVKTNDGSVCDMYGKHQKIIGEFVCDEIEVIRQKEVFNSYALCDASCLTIKEFLDYIGNKTAYIWHISDFKLYEKPMELCEFATIDEASVQSCEHRQNVGQPEYKTAHNGWIKGSYVCTKDENTPEWCEKCKRKILTRPPQSWCYVETLENGGARKMEKT